MSAEAGSELLTRLPDGSIDFDAHVERMVEHIVDLYQEPGFGPFYARYSLKSFQGIAGIGDLYKRMSQMVKARIDAIDPDRLLVAKEEADMKKNPGQYYNWGQTPKRDVWTIL